MSRDSAGDPVASFDFEGPAGTVRDRTGNGHDGEIVRASRVPGRGGTVVEFDKGNEAYVEIGDPDSLDPGTDSYSASLWFRADGVSGGNETLLAKRGGNNERFRITLRETGGEGVVDFRLKDDPGMGNSGSRSNQTYTDGTWHHVVAVRDTSVDELRLYVDGAEVGSTSDEQGNVEPTGPLYLGGQPEYPHPRYFTGALDDVRIYREAVGPGDVDDEPVVTTTASARPPSSSSPSPPPTPTAGSPPTMSTQSFDLRGATIANRLSVGGTEYYLLTDVPGVDPDRRAVTTTGYELVDRDRAWTVIALDTWEGFRWGIDWGDEIDVMEDYARYSDFWEKVGLFTDVAWDVEEIIIFTSLGAPQAAVGPVLDLATDAITWNLDNPSKAYREAFQKFTACTKNARDIEEIATDIATRDDVGDQLQRWTDLSTSMYDSVDEGTTLVGAYSQMANALSSGSGFTSVAETSINHTSSIFLGFAVSTPVNELESVVKTKTKLHAVGYDYAHFRRPVLERLRSVERRLLAGDHSLGDVYVYFTDLVTSYQLNALLLQLNHEYWTQISNSTTGPVWDVLANAEQRAAAAATEAEVMQATIRELHNIKGAGWKTVTTRTANSINAEVMEGSA